MKNTMKKILGVSVLALTFTLALPAWAAIPAPSVDPSSAYTPTKIVNGDFATFPWTDFTYGGVRHTTGFFQSVNNVTVHPNGVDGGWNTTETSVWNATGSLYDNFYDADPSTGSGYPKRSDGTRTLGYVNAHSGSASCGSASLYGKGQNIFIEMNASHADTLYQDLTTYGNDVIRWTLKHAARTDADTYQPITVLIGAPQMSGSSIVYPSGTDAKIVASTLGSYNYAGCSGAYAYANVSELANLRLNKSTQSGAWYTASGVYMIPEGQSVTRFAFRSDATTANAGNFLDDLTFSTLIGNLSAKANGDGSVTVTGYWGDADAAKKLCVKIGETVHQLDMAGVLNQNFTVTIPAATIGSVAQIEVYHQDYESARRTVKIYDHWHCICGDGACTAAGHAHQVVGWDKWTSTTTLPTTAGNWYLANDVTLSATYTAVNGVNLCLNGHVVKGNNFTMPGYGSYKSVIRVPGSVAFTLTDCGTTVRYFTDKNGDRCYETYATVKPSGTEGTDYLTIIGGVLTGARVPIPPTTTTARMAVASTWRTTVALRCTTATSSATSSTTRAPVCVCAGRMRSS